MSDSNQTTFVDPNTDDLNAFDDLLHGRASELTEVAEPASEEQVTQDDEDDADNAVTNTETEDDTLEADDAEAEAEDEGDEEETPAPDEKPKPKTNRYQERIDELTRDKYDAQRRADALESRLDELIKRLDNPTPDKPTTEKAPEAYTGPNPSDTNEDGSEKYPLGEFDPNYIRDLTRHVMAEERAVAEKQQAEKAQLTEQQAAEQKLQSEWSEKLNKSIEDKYPDFLDKNRELEATLRDVDERYGQYLATTIMQMDYGPDVLYHLASNPTEAKAITQMSATKATIALGRLEALYADKAQAERQPKQPLKVSAAPKPPEVNKGTSVSTVVPDDTDDLDAFERKMFDKRRR